MYLMPMFQEKFEAIRRAAWVRPAWLFPVFLFLAASANAQSGGGAGTSAMPGIALVPAARPNGLAGAYTANGTGPTAIGINPAGLARETGRVFSGSVRPDMSRTGAVAYAFPATGGRWAVSATYVDYGEIIATDENQQGQGALQPFNVYPAVSYARTLGSGFYLGGTLKVARESLGDFEGSTPAYGAGFDAGVQYRPSTRGFGWGASLTNIGRQISGHFEGDDRHASLPGAARAGISYEPRRQRELTLVADVEAPFQGDPVLALGGEYRVLSEWILRAGTSWSADDLRNLRAKVDPGVNRDERGGEAVKLAAGTTLRVRSVSVDYAAQWWTELGIVHSLSVAWSLDP